MEINPSSPNWPACVRYVLSHHAHEGNPDADPVGATKKKYNLSPGDELYLRLLIFLKGELFGGMPIGEILPYVREGEKELFEELGKAKDIF